MEIGEILTFTQNEIYEFSISLFQERGVPPTLANIVMQAVCNRFSDSALLQTNKNLSNMICEHESLSSNENEVSLADGNTE